MHVLMTQTDHSGVGV